VNLGVLPGSGGCVRLPRKVGIATALDMILTGKTLSGQKALKAGLADGLIPKQDFETYVVKWILQNLKALSNHERLAKEPKLGGVGGAMGTAMEKTFVGRNVIYKKAREGVLSKSHGNYPAPIEAIDVLQSTHAAYGPKLRGSARDSALAREAKAFGKLAATDVSKNLIRLFFMTEGVKKSKGLAAGVVAQSHPVHSAAVLGAGVMGGGIAQLLADKEIPVRMKDLSAAALLLGIQQATRIFQGSLKRKKIDRRQFISLRSRTTRAFKVRMSWLKRLLKIST
jgi:3-hydroxyacyl-CoA dehydrogenase/enoyl-CoA hydratase/3-hydroxybutyryl-CoA epimerase